MKNILSLIIAGFVCMTSAVYADANKQTNASAAVSFEEGLQFPPCGRVKLNQLVAQSGRVRLRQGWLKLPMGIYRITYSVKLQNSGCEDLMQLWLTTRLLHCKKAQLISKSSVRVGISAAIDSFFLPHVNVSRELIIKLKEPSFISLNYSTNGKSCLSTISSDTLSGSLPFSLIAVRIEEKKGND
ncbi:MAG: hypothetical protein ACHQUC_02765 [Chlamydiales bacterium]